MESVDKKKPKNDSCCGTNCNCKSEKPVTAPMKNVQPCSNWIPPIPMAHKTCGDACKCNSQK